jgi:hypothetical protein
MQVTAQHIIRHLCFQVQVGGQAGQVVQTVVPAAELPIDQPISFAVVENIRRHYIVMAEHWLDRSDCGFQFVVQGYEPGNRQSHAATMLHDDPGKTAVQMKDPEHGPRHFQMTGQIQMALAQQAGQAVPVGVLP